MHEVAGACFDLIAPTGAVSRGTARGDWNEYLDALRAFIEREGGLERAARTLDSALALPAMTWAAEPLPDAARLRLAACCAAVGWRHLRVRALEAEGELHVDLELPPECLDAGAFFFLFEASVRAALRSPLTSAHGPRGCSVAAAAFGAPPAAWLDQVAADARDMHATLHAADPPRPLSPRSAETLGLVARAGRDLAACSDPARFPAEVQRVLREYLGLPSGRYTSGVCVPDAASDALPVRHDGQVVGWLMPGQGTERRRALSRALLPWIEVALGRALSGDDGLERRVLRHTTLWGLTPAQSRVLSRLVRGLSNKEIAADLACAEATVEVHVTALFSASGVAGRTALAAEFWAGRAGTTR